MQFSNTPSEPTLIALNVAMMDAYEHANARFQENLLAQTPVILALFSSSGGRMLLYTPGAEPLEAACVPAVYEHFKAVGHSPVGVYEIVASALASRDYDWRQPLADYADVCRAALEGLYRLDLPDSDIALLRKILGHNVSFAARCLVEDTVDRAGLRRFGRSIAPDLALTVDKAADIQVRHWMHVLSAWRRELGPDWAHTYAASNTLYVTRRNNILFSVLAQFMGEEAIGDRLLLFETPQFTTTSEMMLSGLARVLSDRQLGENFFGCYYLTDSEVLGGAARAAISRESERRGIKTVLPSLAPVRTHEWPWQTEPGDPVCPRTLADAVACLPRLEENT
ncbi:hypothetical protein ACFWZR_25855 [Streptomyces sp. NPDC059017]|uniref:hypothetical protein n=1 Tax=Streptomyces sp. NPDC059017 TaxID=3346700 RepID=UPI0036C135C5